ncbi:hypothetical protein PHMEG_0004790 [Phytophthora megakarya]|uniref:SET domain-containing protein n=1 Tax=Phytophthora megakarya TaxID=4795 RepID=A0A225WUL8_9STRA|nr:hypothetical protein PHMEG_0004790 [Phytophthora megakarya]
MTPPGEIPRWYAECFESSGESDTDTVPHSHDLRTSASPASSRIRSSLDDGKQRSSSSGLASQDGDTAVPPRHNASDSTLSTLDVVLPADSLSQDVSEASVHVWRPERWPDDVERLEAQWNPKALKFPSVSIGIRNGAGCGCEYRCTAVSCLNARESRFCTERNCSFGAFCGNSLKEHPGLVIARSLRTGMRGLVASEDILEGEVIGQYLGHLQLFGPPSKNAPVNNGYRLHLKTRTSGSKHVGIDAFSKGSKLRFMNHSCDPAVRFHEVQTGSTVTVVAVTVRKVYKGEQVTVSYGEKLWFLCRCGWEGCQHRDITAGLEK